MILGKVKFYNSERGFGLIKRADGEKDIRFHLAALKQTGKTSLAEGQKVTFDLLTHPITGKVTAGAIVLA